MPSFPVRLEMSFAMAYYDPCNAISDCNLSVLKISLCITSYFTRALFFLYSHRLSSIHWIPFSQLDLHLPHLVTFHNPRASSNALLHNCRYCPFNIHTSFLAPTTYFPSNSFRRILGIFDSREIVLVLLHSGDPGHIIESDDS